MEATNIAWSGNLSPASPFAQNVSTSTSNNPLNFNFEADTMIPSAGTLELQSLLLPFVASGVGVANLSLSYNSLQTKRKYLTRVLQHPTQRE